MEQPTPTHKPSAGELVLGFLNSKAGNAFLIVVWPLLIAAAGLPTGVTEKLLAVYGGVVACPECPACPAVPVEGADEKDSGSGDPTAAE